MTFNCELIEEMSQMIEDFYKSVEMYVAEARDKLLKINHNRDSYETADGHQYNLNELMVDDIVTIVGDMKQRNNMHANTIQRQGLRARLLAHNKYSPENPYPLKA